MNKKIFVLFLIFLIPVLNAGMCWSAGNGNAGYSTGQSRFCVPQTKHTAEENTLCRAGRNFSFETVARINKRYHEWMSAFLSGGFPACHPARTAFFLSAGLPGFSAPVNSEGLSTCHDLLFLLCLF